MMLVQIRLQFKIGIVCNEQYCSTIVVFNLVKLVVQIFIILLFVTVHLHDQFMNYV